MIIIIFKQKYPCCFIFENSHFLNRKQQTKNIQMLKGTKRVMQRVCVCCLLFFLPFFSSCDAHSRPRRLPIKLVLARKRSTFNSMPKKVRDAAQTSRSALWELLPKAKIFVVFFLPSDVTRLFLGRRRWRAQTVCSALQGVVGIARENQRSHGQNCRGAQKLYSVFFSV